MRFTVIILFCLQVCIVQAQTLGGSATYNFLKLPTSPLLSAKGGVNTSYVVDDVQLSLNNPALMNHRLHGQLGTSFTSFFAGIKGYTLAGAYSHEKSNTTFGGSVFFIDYGNTPQTDAAGNVEGQFRPKEYYIQLSASKKYLSKWSYGVNAKFIHSGLGAYTSSGIAFDIGILYADTANLLSVGMLAKNMGAQFSAYYEQKEDLPFDLQIGITKKLAKAPLGFSLTAQGVHQFDLIYKDTAFNNENRFTTSSSFGNKLVSHFVLATHIYLGNNLQVDLGYNQLRRLELNIGNSGNGLNGFSGGFRAQFKKLHIQYARAYFQRASAYNQLGVNLMLNQLFGIGNSGI